MRSIKNVRSFMAGREKGGVDERKCGNRGCKNRKAPGVLLCFNCYAKQQKEMK